MTSEKRKEAKIKEEEEEIKEWKGESRKKRIGNVKMLAKKRKKTCCRFRVGGSLVVGMKRLTSWVE